MNKTKVMISGERQNVTWSKTARWPCGVCGRGVGSNSIYRVLDVRSGYTKSAVAYPTF